ncbi:MAG: hypothetical protein LC798_12770 [Chloroflexi bacterium]|nr:hypothetical protein [Chloroflexota bacterium]
MRLSSTPSPDPIAFGISPVKDWFLNCHRARAEGYEPEPGDPHEGLVEVEPGVYGLPVDEAASRERDDG